jgi:hypothetical protein
MKRTLKNVLYDAGAQLWADIITMKWVVILIIAYFVFMRNILYSLCPMVLLTGYPCPACGLTRAFVCMLQFDWSGALKVHPFIYIIVIYLFAFVWNRYIRLAQMGSKLTWAAILIIIAMLIYYIWRMIYIFPGEPPMSYYYRNLLAILKSIIQSARM